MGDVIGLLLPLAVVVAFSPTTIAVVLAILLSDANRLVPIAFAIGYTVGIVADLMLFLAVSGLAGLASGTAGDLAASAWIQIVVGAVLVGFGFDQWSKRPKALEDPVVPRWLVAMGELNVWKAAAVSVFLAALRPKNILMFAAASVAISTGGLSVGETVTVVAVFVVICASTVAGVVTASLVGQERVRPMLTRTKSWLEANSTAMMSALMLLIGVVLFGRGLGLLW